MQLFYNKKLILFWTKDTEIPLLSVEIYRIKIDIVGYYLQPNSMALKLWNFKYLYIWLQR